MTNDKTKKQPVNLRRETLAQHDRRINREYRAALRNVQKILKKK